GTGEDHPVRQPVGVVRADDRLDRRVLTEDVLENCHQQSSFPRSWHGRLAPADRRLSGKSRARRPCHERIPLPQVTVPLLPQGRRLATAFTTSSCTCSIDCSALIT